MYICKAYDTLKENKDYILKLQKLTFAQQPEKFILKAMNTSRYQV